MSELPHLETDTVVYHAMLNDLRHDLGVAENVTTRLQARLDAAVKALHRVNELSMNATVGCYNATTTVRDIYELSSRMLKDLR
jgi:hypothetical protein